MENIVGYSWEEIQAKQQRKDIGKVVNTKKSEDYGCDPLGNGMFKMVPSGDIVDFAERNKRLEK